MRLNFNILIFMEVNVALCRIVFLKIRQLKNQLGNSRSFKKMFIPTINFVL